MLQWYDNIDGTIPPKESNAQWQVYYDQLIPQEDPDYYDDMLDWFISEGILP
jgi:hypothetical protein